MNELIQAMDLSSSQYDLLQEVLKKHSEMLIASIPNKEFNGIDLGLLKEALRDKWL